MLIFSHGNASVESGFSINKDMIAVQKNLAEESLVAQRMVYDAVRAGGGPLEMPIGADLIKSAKLSHKRYKEALERKSDADKKIAMEAKNSAAKAKEKLQLLEERKRKLEEEAKDARMELGSIDVEIKRLKQS